MEGASCPFFYFKYKTDWIYIVTVMGSCPDPNLNGMSLCLITRSFNPEKNQNLLELLAHQYVSTGDPTKILEGYLSVYTTGVFKNSKGSFKAADFDDEKALLSNCNLSELIGTFEADTVILWNAILLKKRILVYADTVPKVLEIIRTFPCLAIHRKDWNVFRPVIRDEPDHMDDLQAAGVYIAGTVDSSLTLRTDLFDVIVSVPDRRITVVEGSTDDMRMGALHREILNLMVPPEPNGMTSAALIAAIGQKTTVVLERLQSIQQTDKSQTEEAIMNLSKNDATNRWLAKLAAAEGII
jgi:hypothetical protein